MKENYISESARIFKNCRIVNSTILEHCVVGDDCDIVDTTLSEKSELGRRNLIRNTVLGRGSYTGTNTIIKNADIGKYTSISWNVSIGGGNHDYHNTSTYTDYWYNRTFGVKNTEVDSNTLRTKIGNDVWIGSGVTVINGVTIGDGVVLGAGTVITQDIPPYSVVVGVPGRIKNKRFSDDVIELLEALKWWDWAEEKIISKLVFLKNTPTKDIILELMENP